MYRGKSGGTRLRGAIVIVFLLPAFPGCQCSGEGHDVVRKDSPDIADAIDLDWDEASGDSGGDALSESEGTLGGDVADVPDRWPFDRPEAGDEGERWPADDGLGEEIVFQSDLHGESDDTADSLADANGDAFVEPTGDVPVGAEIAASEGLKDDVDMLGDEAGESQPCPAGYVVVPAGTFTMGSPPDDPLRLCISLDETQHQVTINTPFCMKATEVTQEEWQALMGNCPSMYPGTLPDLPVEGISWWDALGFCNSLSDGDGLPPCYVLSGCVGTPGMAPTLSVPAFQCDGVAFQGVDCPGYRLPTEAEWEYAARAGTIGGTYNGTASFTGYCHSLLPDPVLDPIAWWAGNSPGQKQPVGLKTPNGWGLFDMLGNVGELVWDTYDSYPTDPAIDPTGPSWAGWKVNRGGSWICESTLVRAAYRTGDDPLARGKALGFRTVRGIQ